MKNIIAFVVLWLLLSSCISKRAYREHLAEDMAKMGECGQMAAENKSLKEKYEKLKESYRALYKFHMAWQKTNREALMEEGK